MTIALGEDDHKQAVASIVRYCAENLEAEVSQLEAARLLKFFLGEIAPSVYNSGVATARAATRTRGSPPGRPLTSVRSRRPSAPTPGPWPRCGLNGRPSRARPSPFAAWL